MLPFHPVLGSLLLLHKTTKLEPGKLLNGAAKNNIVTKQKSPLTKKKIIS